VDDGLVLRRMASFLPLESYVSAKKHIDSWFSLQKEGFML